MNNKMAKDTHESYVELIDRIWCSPKASADELLDDICTILVNLYLKGFNFGRSLG